MLMLEDDLGCSQLVRSRQLECHQFDQSVEKGSALRSIRS